MLAVAIAAGLIAAPRALHAESLAIVVTNPGDVLEELEAECPHEELCTLRAAIALVNADLDADDYTITFDPDVFGAPEPSPILLATALPDIARPNVTINAIGVDVRVQPDTEAEIETGVVLAGANGAVRALRLGGFTQACIRVLAGPASVGGDAAVGGNRLGGCGVAVDIRAPGVTVIGNAIGFAADGATAAPVGTGIHVLASSTTIGAVTPAFRNTIGNAATGVLVGSGSPADPAITATIISRNVLGRSPAGEAAPNGTGILLDFPSAGTQVVSNTIANSSSAGIAVADDINTSTVEGNTFRSNIFDSIAGLAIDLRNDGIRNPNDLDDSDTGPNRALNHPVFTNATQSHLRGYAGPSCAAPNPPCMVEVYTADHIPGAEFDNGTAPIPLGLVTTDVSATFTINTPSVAAGTWLVAITTDADGNTSEFGVPTRVGAGAVACGNVEIVPGWNHVGFFGGAPLQLGLVFPPSTAGLVWSIHALVDGEDTFLRWFENTIVGRTLETLVAPRAYWFNAKSGFTLQGGIAVTEPLPVELKAGWNDFVYVGGGADVRDALSSIAGKWTTVYTWENTGSAARWLRFGAPETPDWARDFLEMEPCHAYQVFVTEDTTLVPLQP